MIFQFIYRCFLGALNSVATGCAFGRVSHVQSITVQGVVMAGAVSLLAGVVELRKSVISALTVYLVKSRHKKWVDSLYKKSTHLNLGCGGRI